jgi:hypothetical protein
MYGIYHQVKLAAILGNRFLHANSESPTSRQGISANAGVGLKMYAHSIAGRFLSANHLFVVLVALYPFKLVAEMRIE